MGGKSQPDFGQIAAAEGEEMRESVRDQLWANRPDQYTPFGYSKWTSESVIDPTTGEPVTKWSQTQGLTPELQEQLNKQTALGNQRSDLAWQMGNRMASEFGAPMNWGALASYGENPYQQFTVPENVERQLSYEGIQGPMQPNQQTSIDTAGLSGVDDPYQTRQRAEDAVYSQAMSRLAPQQEGARESLEVKMRNQGLRPGDAAWDSQMAGLRQQQTDATNQALWSANQAGRAESDSMFGQQMSRRQQGFGERAQQGSFANQALQNLYNQSMGNRQQLTGERDRMGAFYNQAANQAFNQNLAANQQNYQQMMQGSNYANQLRQQQMAEMMQQRGFSLNEINALMSGQQVGMPQMPDFMAAQQAQVPNYTQAASDQASAQNAASPWGALLGAGSSILGAGIGAGWFG